AKKDDILKKRTTKQSLSLVANRVLSINKFIVKKSITGIEKKLMNTTKAVTPLNQSIDKLYGSGSKA
ncbi:MAG: hypothetical protein ACXWV8_04045, partial [Chitinophagaceae bacterium]